MQENSSFGGRHELGQNFLVHRPTINLVLAEVRATRGSILELGAGGGALTRPLAGLGRNLLAVDLDPRCVRRLQQALPEVVVRHGDALTVPLERPVIVGNIPFHLTTPVLRRLLAGGAWEQAVLLTQWEVARKRAGVGGGTMLTAQSCPWFEFRIRGRVPAAGFVPRPGVDGGVLTIVRRVDPLINPADRKPYGEFVRGIFTGPGAGMGEILALLLGSKRARTALRAADVPPRALPRDVGVQQWPQLWQSAGGQPHLRRRDPGRARRLRSVSPGG